MIGGLDPIFKENFIEFSIDFREIENLGIRPLGGFPVFQTGYDIVMPCGFLAEFRETGSHSKTCDDCHVPTSESGRDIE